MIQGDFYSVCPLRVRQFRTLPDLLSSRVALPNSYPYARDAITLKDKYPYFEVGLKCIIMVF